MTLDLGLVAVRFVHYIALLILFGTCVFPLYTYAGGDSVQPAGLAAKLRAGRVITAALALVSGIMLFIAVAASMVGAWSDLDWAALQGVMTATSFGPIWVAHLVLIAAVLLITVPRAATSSRSMNWILVVSSGAILASLACIGHTQDGAGLARTVHVLADALHLLAAGAWLGGILALFYLVSASVRSPGPIAAQATLFATARFSGLGTIVVAVLVGSGIINAWILVGSIESLISTPYGQALLFKLALFGGMLLYAALNRFRIVPALLDAHATCRSINVLIRLRRHVVGEQALGFFVILVVSALGTMEPAINAVRH